MGVSGTRTEEKVVALTFDDGPLEWTRPILDVLERHGASATFFVIGRWVDATPDIAKDVTDRGHEIGNHTYNHPNLTMCDDQRIREELKRTNDAIGRACDLLPTQMRAPGGATDGRVTDAVRSVGFRDLIHWDVDPEDWRRNVRSASEIADTVCGRVTAGDVVLLHDGLDPELAAAGLSAQPTVDALASILARLSGEGFRFLAVSELLSIRDA
jgi:peptidoglycan-N-acetylglucosamine deacetylase